MVKFYKWPGPGDLWTVTVAGFKFEVSYIAPDQGWALIAYDPDGYDVRRVTAPTKDAAFTIADAWVEELKREGDLYDDEDEG